MFEIVFIYDEFLSWHALRGDSLMKKISAWQDTTKNVFLIEHAALAVCIFDFPTFSSNFLVGTAE